MPMQSILLRPGVDVEQTAALNAAGISQSQLIRTKNGLTQTMGGWQQFGTTIPSTVRSLHAWQDITNVDYLGVAATNNLVALTSSSYYDITPQTRISSVAPNVSISSGSNVVTIVDVNAGLTTACAVVFQTPISIGDILLQGAYPVNSAPSTGSFTVVSSVTPSTTIASSGTLPVFGTVTGSALVSVTEPNHTARVILGQQQNFLVPTTVGGLTIQGPYSVSVVNSTTQYIIISPAAATGTVSSTMNGGVARYLYYIVENPTVSALGYGGGPYGAGAYGSGATPSADVGTPITSVDWTQDNWGEILLAVQKDGPVFQWSPDQGFFNASLVPQAPLTNGGGFISMPQQILVLWKSVQATGTQDNLIVRWSDAQDFTNWTVSEQTVAGSFHIPTGSVIRGGLQAPNYGVIWTDVDVWIMQFLGSNPELAFNFTRAGSGCGLLGPHAANVIAGDIYWASQSNFYIMSGSGVQILPCTVWDFFFQNINTAQQSKVVCGPNSEFSEVVFNFPFGTATENNAYVKFNIMDKTWDYGFWGRTAWEDVNVLGAPFGADAGGIIWHHEMGNMISGAGNTFFKTGWWAISDGEDLSFVDFVMPDFQWGTYGNNDASIQLLFFSADYPGDTPRTYGPYTVTQANQYITPRIRGRLMAMQATSANNDIFWRIGRIRYRYAPAGRR